jgi:predicted MFS family arabinose efflux permease
LITFINRAGTMVLPFLSKYLKEDLNLSYAEVGWIMVAFGMGSMLFLAGGKLSDKIGLQNHGFQFVHQRNTAFHTIHPYFLGLCAECLS